MIDGSIIDVPDIAFTKIDGVRAYRFSKAAVAARASANGYTDYDVRFTFVPDGSDGSFFPYHIFAFLDKPRRERNTRGGKLAELIKTMKTEIAGMKKAVNA